MPPLKITLGKHVKHSRKDKVDLLVLWFRVFPNPLMLLARLHFSAEELLLYPRRPRWRQRQRRRQRPRRRPRRHAKC